MASDRGTVLKIVGWDAAPGLALDVSRQHDQGGLS